MIEYIEHMGDDLRVVNAARVSFAKQKDEFSKGDSGLLKFLLRHNHWTPFAHPQITFRITMPIFIARQWFKHMIGFTRNEVSRRYVDNDPTFFIPDFYREKNIDKKQGSHKHACAQSQFLIEETEKKHKSDMRFYRMLLAAQVAPEQARASLPQSMNTQFYETGSLAAYLRLIHLRTDATAQQEIQDYAAEIESHLKSLFPETFKALSQNDQGHRQ